MRKLFESYHQILISCSSANSTFFIIKNKHTTFLLSLLLKFNFITIQKLLKKSVEKTKFNKFNYYYLCKKNFSSYKNKFYFKNYTTSRRVFFLKNTYFLRLRRQLSKNLYYLIYTKKGLICTSSTNTYIITKNHANTSIKMQIFNLKHQNLPKGGFLLGKFKLF
jgi:hypothetical protein